MDRFGRRSPVAAGAETDQLLRILVVEYGEIACLQAIHVVAEFVRHRDVDCDLIAAGSGCVARRCLHRPRLDCGILILRACETGQALQPSSKYERQGCRPSPAAARNQMHSVPLDKEDCIEPSKVADRVSSTLGVTATTPVYHFPFFFAFSLFSAVSSCYNPLESIEAAACFLSTTKGRAWRAIL
jgi:hypothetical protein